jgi:hypothetical protein
MKLTLDQRLFERYFDAQELADIAADPEELVDMRLAALALLDAGATEHYRIRVDDDVVHLSRLAYLIIQQQARDGDTLSAIESLSVFTGLPMHNSACVIASLIETMD